MSRFVFKLPDLGEGTVEAEIVSWRVKPGDQVNEEDTIAEVMTEKAVVEVPAPVTGKVISITGQPGDRVPVGAELIVFETSPDAGAEAAQASSTDQTKVPKAESSAARKSQQQPAEARTGRVLTSPAIRRQAREAGIDLTSVAGTGPNGRIVRGDIQAMVREQSSAPSPSATRKTRADEITEVKVIGLRRVIAQRMSEATRNIPHFSYVEEVDVTALEALRTDLNSELEPAEQLTYLPFLVIAMTRALTEFPQCNALYDADGGMLLQHSAVHVGIATQTPDGLKVPVVRDAHNKTLWEIASEARRVSEAARTNRATREELSGSTITVTSLGKLGGIASTPIINAPEMAIIGVNRAVERPVVHAGAIAVRRMMNLSSSFDHRFIDGHVAASLIHAVKNYLENPARMFVPPLRDGG
ncbi:MAG: dihydrolipoamide acetyltransferase family protein [Steroidobacteraceae bacterium]